MSYYSEQNYRPSQIYAAVERDTRSLTPGLASGEEFTGQHPRHKRISNPATMSRDRYATKSQLVHKHSKTSSRVAQGEDLGLDENQIQVSATAEISSVPDVCKITINVCGEKENVQEVKASVSRRLDYVLQTLHNHQIKEGDIVLAKTLNRDGRLYRYNANVNVKFVDFQKCQIITNILVEKLDKYVKIDSPEFSHSRDRIEQIRRQATLDAVQNAKIKATEIAGLLGKHVGQALSVREESMEEWEGEYRDNMDDNIQMPFSQWREQSSLTVLAKVSASFEMHSHAKLHGRSRCKCKHRRT